MKVIVNVEYVRNVMRAFGGCLKALFILATLFSCHGMQVSAPTVIIT
jgi:hypothetical protein